MKKLILIFSLGLVIIACKKEVDSPPENILTDGQIITMDSLLAMYDGEPIKFDKDVSVFATVTMDEVDGNVYKNIFIQDGNAAINMRLASSGDLFVGDYIRINLNGTVLSKYSGIMQLDSVDYAKHIAVQSTNQPLTPKVVSLTDLSNSFITLLATEPSDPNIQWEYTSQLIKLKDVQFSAMETNGTYADGPGQQSKDVILEDCAGNQIIVRSSGYSNFANDSIAKGKGDLTVIVSRYNSTLQLLIRSIDEVNMSENRCAGQLISKDFEDESITSGGWSVQQVIGTDTWEIGFFGSDALKIQNYDFGTMTNEACENWFLSPQIDLTNSPTASMSFDNDTRYSGDQLKLLVSTDYSGLGDPNGSTWVDISTSVSWDPNTNDWGFHNTGLIDLTQFVGNSIYIGFKYTGSDSNGATWELDNISVNG